MRDVEHFLRSINCRTYPVLAKFWQKFVILLSLYLVKTKTPKNHLYRLGLSIMTCVVIVEFKNILFFFLI